MPLAYGWTRRTGADLGLATLALPVMHNLISLVVDSPIHIFGTEYGVQPGRITTTS